MKGWGPAYRRRADGHDCGREDRGSLWLYLLCSNSNCFWLACAEGDDAPNRIVRRDANGYAIARDYLDAEAAHSAAELGQHFVSGITLHAVETAAVDRNHGALHINEIILAQLLARPFFQTNIVPQLPDSHNWRVVNWSTCYLQCPSTRYQPCRPSRTHRGATQRARARGGRSQRPGTQTYARPSQVWYPEIQA